MTTLEGQIKQSVDVLHAMTTGAEMDKAIPTSLLSKARGIVFMTEVKAGFIWSGSVAGGILISKLDDGKWSAPSSLGSGGMGFGFQAGAQKTDTIILLFDKNAVGTFASAGSLKFGGDVSVSAGPLGRSLQADARLGTQGMTGSLSYSHAQGLFGGLSLTGAMLIAREKDNAAFYKQEVSVNDLVSGKIPPPPEAQVLYDALDAVCSAPPPPPASSDAVNFGDSK